MAVNNQVSTNRVREAGNYFYKLLKENWKVRENELEVDNPTFGLMVKEAAYAASLFLNPISTGKYSLHLKEQEIDTGFIPDEKMCKHIITTVACYSTGTRKFTRADIQELGDACNSLVKCIETLEKGKNK
jgi:hypothetical protein